MARCFIPGLRMDKNPDVQDAAEDAVAVEVGTTGKKMGRPADLSAPRPHSVEHWLDSPPTVAPLPGARLKSSRSAGARRHKAPRRPAGGKRPSRKVSPKSKGRGRGKSKDKLASRPEASPEGGGPGTKEDDSTRAKVYVGAGWKRERNKMAVEMEALRNRVAVLEQLLRKSDIRFPDGMVVPDLWSKLGLLPGTQVRYTVPLDRHQRNIPESDADWRNGVVSDWNPAVDPSLATLSITSDTGEYVTFTSDNVPLACHTYDVEYEDIIPGDTHQIKWKRLADSASSRLLRAAFTVPGRKLVVDGYTIALPEIASYMDASRWVGEQKSQAWGTKRRLRTTRVQDRQPPPPDPAMLELAATGNVTTLQNVVEFDGPDAVAINGVDWWQRTMLHHAARAGNKRTAKWLLKQLNIEVDCCEQHDNTPLHFAAQGGHISVVKLLLEHRADRTRVNVSKQTPLDAAAAADLPELTMHSLNELLG